MSMYDLFSTDAELEKTGIWLEYGSFRVKTARAGGSNKRYAKRLEAELKPYRRAIQTGTMADDTAEEIIRKVFAETIVLAWEIKGEDGNWKSGIEGPDGSVLPFTAENVVSTFKALPDLFSDIREQSGKVALFRKVILEEDSGNS